MFFDQMEIIFFTFGSKKMGDPARGLTKKGFDLWYQKINFFFFQKMKQYFNAKAGNIFLPLRAK